MRTRTLGNIVTNIERMLSQVSGIGAQFYTEPIIIAKVQEQFDVVFGKDWWQQFRGSVSITTTVGTGLPTNDFTVSPIIRGLEDIQYIFPSDRRHPLKFLPPTINPDEVTGNSARFFEPVADATKIFRVLPLNSTTVLRLLYRSLPSEYATNDTVNFDAIYLENIVAWDIVNSDGNNPGESEKFQVKAIDRLNQLKSMYARHPLPIGPQTQDIIPDEWFIGRH